MRQAVLIVAQQIAVRAAVGSILFPLGYRVETASTEKAARRLLATERFGAAVVAAGARELALLHKVQQEVGKLIVLAEDITTSRRFASLFPGALICLSQPLETEKLFTFFYSLSHAKAPIDGNADAAKLMHFEGCTLDVQGQTFLTAARQEVALTRREFALLVAFVRSPGRVLSRAQLRNAIDGGNTDAFDRSIDMLLTRLRRKIEPNPTKPQFIVTVLGTGYKFVPCVEEVDRSSQASVTPAPNRDHQAQSEHHWGQSERRTLTVLCCQVLGFAALAAKMDPEDLEGVLNQVYATCEEIIARFGGTMVRGIGDNMLAYFGYPTAREHDAESGTRAALELVRALGKIEAPPIGRFKARIGVATGLMLIGDVSSGKAKEPIVVGEALNLALHMQKAAAAEDVVIGQRTRDLIGRLFDCRQTEPIILEEGDAPEPVWRVVDEIARTPRFDALRRDGMLDLVGREVEIERLSKFWSDTRLGKGQVVLLTGEAGIGKSRLIVELEQKLQDEPHNTIRYFGSPHRADAPMSVILDELQTSADLTPSDTPSQKLAKIQKAFTVLGPAAIEASTLISRFIGLTCEAPEEISELSPQKAKERTFAALLERIELMASHQRLFAVVEDGHWVDPISIEFLACLVERAATLPMLLVISARPEFTPPWPDYSYVTRLALSRLSQSNSAALIHEVAADRRISPQIEAEILSRADGVPLFIEELTKSILEDEANGYGRNSHGAGEGDQKRFIPTTLHGLLVARFGRLECGREVAQAGAVIGREFTLAQVRIVTGVAETTLVSALDQLVSAGLVFRRGSPAQSTFVFKHALVRDAAYDMLPRQRRQKIHAGVARCYEEHFPETVEGQPELLAYHYGEAGDAIKTVGYLFVAAERAVRCSFASKALAHLAQARHLISTLPDSRERLQHELKLEITMGRAFIAERSYTAPETREAYRRAKARCGALGDQVSLPVIIHAQWVSAWSAADFQSALREAEELYFWGERNNEPTGKAVAHVDFGMTLTILGDLLQAHRHLKSGLRINQFLLPGRQPFMFSDTEPGRGSALTYLHYCLLLRGFPDQAKAVANEVALLRPQQLYTRALMQIYVLRMLILERRVTDAANAGAAALQLSQNLGYPYFIAASMVHMGWALAQGGDTAGGIESCRSGLAQLRNINVKCWLPFYLALLAECYEQAGDTEHGIQSIAEAMEVINTTGERAWEAEIYRLKGRLLLRSESDTSAAQACFVEALKKARMQNAKLLELRAAVSLADLLKRRPSQAREVLAPVYRSFTEGFDSIDLREARVLLDSLVDVVGRVSATEQSAA